MCRHEIVGGYDYEYVVDDPAIGQVSLNDEPDARDYANRVDGEAYCLIWQGGRVLDRQLLS